MIVGTLGIPKSAFLLEPHPADASPPNNSSLSITSCSSQNHKEYKIPKLEAFSRTKLERALKDPPLISKSQNQLAEYCTQLEGEDSYSCWQAYFELKDLEKEYTKEEVERLIIEAGGVKSLIGWVHGVAGIRKASTHATCVIVNREEEVANKEEHIHIPDGLPKTAQELEEEESSMMPDSAYTRLLRLTATLPSPPHLSL